MTDRAHQGAFSPSMPHSLSLRRYVQQSSTRGAVDHVLCLSFWFRLHCLFLQLYYVHRFVSNCHVIETLKEKRYWRRKVKSEKQCRRLETVWKPLNEWGTEKKEKWCFLMHQSDSFKYFLINWINWKPSFITVSFFTKQITSKSFQRWARHRLETT